MLCNTFGVKKRRRSRSCNAQGVVDGTPKWVSCAKEYLLPVKVLSRVFRGKYLEGVREAFEEGKLKWPRHVNGSMDADGLRKWLGPLYRKEWVVYSKRPWVRSLRGARNQRNGYMICIYPEGVVCHSPGSRFAHPGYADRHQHLPRRGYTKARSSPCTTPSG